MVVFNKASALFAYNNWNRHNSNVAKAVERIASGKRINRAADDPAGLAISENMKAQLRVLERQKDITASEMDALNVMDGAMAGVQDMLRRLTDLSAMAAGDTLDDKDREILDIEYQALLEEIDRVGANTKYNSKQLFQGALAEEDAQAGTITLKGVNLTDYLDALDDFMKDWSGKAEELRGAVMDFTRGYAATYSGQAVGYTITVGGGNVEVKQEAYSSSSFGLAGTDLRTQEHAQAAEDAVKKAVEEVAKQRARYGAEQSRLSHRTNSLTAMEEGLTDAYARLTDADIAKEYMTFVREQTLAQAASFMMAHVNTSAYQVLTLLQ